MTKILRVYLWWLGLGLLLQGLLSILLRAIYTPPPIYARTDPLHASIHIVWGLVILLLLRQLKNQASKRKTDRSIAFLGLLFGIFFLSLGFLGVLIHNPFGMLLGRIENYFHLIVSFIALILSVQILKKSI